MMEHFCYMLAVFNVLAFALYLIFLCFGCTGFLFSIIQPEHLGGFVDVNLTGAEAEAGFTSLPP